MTASTTTPQDLTPEQAEADLATLEQAVVAGEAVTVEQLTQAKERISFVKLVQMGRDARAEAKRVSAAAAARKAAKIEAKGIIEALPADVLAKFDAAVEAMQALIDVAKTHNEGINDVWRAFGTGGVAAVGWEGSTMPDHDAANFARVGQGEIVSSVTVDGQVYLPNEPAEWVQHAIVRVARANDGLTLPRGSGSIERFMGETRFVPYALEQRDTAGL
ncbi:hypothetical protein E3T28_15935 [Cryobacterium sinapicolor]|uniref:Uncharacterized protein n=1 Tax=Cryobacterium sinapicolor TaxID=1259236 RepID=A0ABY2IT56_9MICO|nr:hypothetical protein [Cryobacterium sinapicolor]TFC94045.1 hypothetical protein E3T28_15935 [Cryobacterium sinapicolor]